MMNYFKDIKNRVFAYSDIQTPAEGLTAITEAEALALTNPPPTTEQQAAQVRAERNGKIEAVRWRIERARDEAALGLALTEPIEPLLVYAQALRDVPEQAGFPGAIVWPVEP